MKRVDGGIYFAQDGNPEGPGRRDLQYAFLCGTVDGLDNPLLKHVLDSETQSQIIQDEHRFAAGLAIQGANEDAEMPRIPLATRVTSFANGKTNIIVRDDEIDPLVGLLQNLVERPETLNHFHTPANIVPRLLSEIVAIAPESVVH